MLRTAAARASASGPSFMIGDSSPDIAMGRAFGARTVWCAWGYAKETAERPEFTAQRPADLVAIVRDAFRGVSPAK
jgi:phosphoglycolate phosphatase-like HAD superfamily hydrolase